MARRVDAKGLAERYADIADRVAALAEELDGTPTLTDAEQVIAPLAPRRPTTIASAVPVAAQAARLAAHGNRLPELGGPLTLAQSINAALADALAARPEALLFGEDVGRKGGVYGLTRGLAAAVRRAARLRHAARRAVDPRLRPRPRA